MCHDHSIQLLDTNIHGDLPCRSLSTLEALISSFDRAPSERRDALVRYVFSIDLLLNSQVRLANEQGRFHARSRREETVGGERE